MPATMHYDKTLKETRAHSSIPLSEHIANVLNTYFDNMGDQVPDNLYALIMTEMEGPLLDAVMRYCKGNQSKAAKILGINRGTFRKKLAYYGML